MFSSVFPFFITTSNGNATGKAQETPRKRYSFTSIDKGHTKNPDYSKAKDQDLCTARNIAKKLEAQGSRLSFSFSSDFYRYSTTSKDNPVWYSLQKIREKRKKYFQTKPRTETAQQWVPKKQKLYFPRNSATVSGSLNQYIMFSSVFSFSSQPVTVTPGKSQENTTKKI